MKPIISILLTSFLVLAAGCQKEEELVPKTKGYEKEYVLPQARSLTTEERALVKERRDEYNESIK
ncbi:hypothetical protein [Chitinophaga defluvii]|uniref:Lipoprotein n=1 Tax=Chitinophaga defluvii TaxID=3163343 RepID=A0ABV2T836_9BACT